MTRDEHRAKCILDMAIAAHDADVSTEIEPVPWEDEIEEVRTFWINVETAAFDSLHGIVRVNPIWPDQDMVDVGYEAYESHGDLDKAYESHGDLDNAFEAMSAVGDLTNPPETKP